MAFPLTDLDAYETAHLGNGTRLVSHPVTPELKASFDVMRRIASYRYDGDGWWRGFWAGRWHFAASEADIRQMLATALREGHIQL